MHERGTFSVGAGPERPSLYKSAGICENIGSEVSQAAALVRIAACTRAEQHDAFDPIAVELIEGGTEPAQYLVVVAGGPRRGAGLANFNPLAGSHWNQPHGEGEKPSIPHR